MESSLLQILFEDPEVGRCLVDGSGRVVRANRAWLDANGVSGDELSAVCHDGWASRIPSLAPSLHARAREGVRVAVPPHLGRGSNQWWRGFIDRVDYAGGTHTLVGLRPVGPTTTQELAQLQRETEERLRIAVEGSDLGTWELDVATGMLHFSAGRKELFGLAGGHSALFSAFVARVRPSDQPQVEAAMARALDPAGDGKYRAAYRWNPPGGTERWVRTAGQAYFATVNGTRTAVRVVGTVFDVTEQESAQQAFRESEQRFRLALRNAPVSVAAQDRDLRYVWAYNQRTIGPGQMLGKRDEDIFSPAEAAHLTAIKRRVLESGAEHREQMWLERPTGRMYLDICWEPIRDEAGGIVGVASATVDLTARKLAEEALHEREERLAVTLRSIGDAVIVTDEDAKVLMVNGAAEMLTGWPAEEAIGRLLSDIFVITNEDTRAVPPNPVERVLREGHVVGLANHTVLVSRDGGERPIADSGAPIRDRDGKVRGVVLVFRDQTEERRAERALRESEARWRALIEKSTEIIAVLDARGRYTFWSQGASESLGWRSDEMADVPLIEMVHPDDRAHVAELQGNLVAAPGAIVTDSLRFRRKDGTWRLLEATARNLLADPVVGGVVVNARDVTQQRELEDQLRQSQKLESVGQLAGGVAHDFNNMLAAILGHVELALEDLGPAEPLRASLSEIQKAAQRASRITHQLLAFSRKQVLEPTVLDLNVVVTNLEKMLRRLIGENIELQTVLAPDLDRVKADLGQIEQVIVNLVVNARDAMPEGGQLRLSTSNAELGRDGAPTRHEVVPGSYVRIDIGDSGCGMDGETLRRMFEPFFTTKAKGKGTGLGLSTVYGIVKQSGGNIEVDSVPGKGTTFSIFLPRSADEITPPAASLVPPSPAGGGATILVVEDDDSVRQVTVSLLRRAGYRVLSTESPTEALQICERAKDERDNDKVRLVVTDVVMPQMNGRQLALRLRSLQPGLCVLYMSGYADSEIAHHGVLEAGTTLIRKPFGAANLLCKVREALGEE